MSQSHGPAQGPLYVGVDVGTGSVRAALVTHTGDILSTASHELTIMEPQVDFYEQSSDGIWQACCNAVRMVVDGIPKTQIHGIGFDATCSLVVLDGDFKPLKVSPSGTKEWNVVMWMDHRATEQAERITKTKHDILKFVGGTMSPELQMPKLLWLKENMKADCWDRAGHFFDLPDFLTWKASGSLSRSLCSVVCKWTYQADGVGTQGWNDDFLNAIGLQDLKTNNYIKIGNEVKAPGDPCGEGLTEKAAAELGLAPNTPVATSLVDAHCGGLGTLGCMATGLSEQSNPLTSRLALVCGTSSCHMTVSDEPVFVPGVWGPYFSAMVPGFYLNEGGQSATGKLVDHVIEKHPAYTWLKEEAHSRKVHVHDLLSQVLEHNRKNCDLDNVAYLTKSLHVWPDFHGNRSPLADPTLKGMVSGLTFDSGIESLARYYLATIQALAYGTRHILEAMKGCGHEVKVLYACGGLSKNKVFLRTHADVTSLPVIKPKAKEPVLLGGAMLGACASKDVSSIQEAMAQMAGEGDIISPDPATLEYHEKKYKVFLKMMEHQRECQKLMY